MLVRHKSSFYLFCLAVSVSMKTQCYWSKNASLLIAKRGIFAIIFANQLNGEKINRKRIIRFL